jgi:protein gp37
MAKRLKGMGQPNYTNGFNLAIHEQILELPHRWKKARTILVNSMSDLFHEEVPVEFIQRVFSVMRQANWHRFQILTKRSARLLELNSLLSWMPHVWIGVSVENQDYTFRIDQLRRTNAHVKFLSFEPLLGPLPKLNLRGIDWVIVGGESGPGARHMERAWVIDILNQCRKMGVSFFFKQWGGVNRKKFGRKLEGREWDEMPSQAEAIC